MKKRIEVILFLFISIYISGCSEGVDMIEEDNTIESLTLENPILIHNYELDGFKIQTEFEILDYDMKEWKITDSKDINIRVSVLEQPEDSEILLQNFHSDVSIKATDGRLNGIQQDSMDFSYKGTTQDGFMIDANHNFENIFNIDGLSKEIMEGWGYYTGDYGSINIESKRLTESNLYKRGVYASQVVVVWNFIIKDNASSKYYIKTVRDKILIPVNHKVESSLEPKGIVDKLFQEEDSF